MKSTVKIFRRGYYITSPKGATYKVLRTNIENKYVLENAKKKRCQVSQQMVEKYFKGGN